MVCEDGSVWQRGDVLGDTHALAKGLGTDQVWKEQLPIPGSDRAMEE